MKIALFVVGGISVLLGAVYAARGHKYRMSGVYMIGIGLLCIGVGLFGKV